jgi:hypothetical protein
MRWLTAGRAIVGGAAVVLAGSLQAQNVLIVNGASTTSEVGTTASITTQLTTLHTAVGNIVTVADTRPADLTPYRQVWDIRFSNSSPLDGADQAAYLAFLQGGGGMFIMGENSFFATRNSSIFSFIGLAGGGSIGFGAGPSTQQVCAPFTGPNPVASVPFLAPGWFDGRGTGQWIVAPDCATSTSDGSGIAWSVGSLANATAGALTTILDVNFMQDNANAQSQALTANLIGFVGQQVNPVPEPGTVVLLTSGLVAVGLVARRRRAA